MSDAAKDTYVRVESCGRVKIRGYDAYVGKWNHIVDIVEELLDAAETDDQFGLTFTVLPPMTPEEWENYCEDQGVDVL